MQTYQLTLQHDTGKLRIKIVAKDKETAKHIVCLSEGCPPCAIIAVRELKTKAPAKPAFKLW